MALECVCFPLVDPRLANGPQRTNRPGQQQQSCEDRKTKADLDLCKIVKRSRDNENNKHSEYECHLKGERRQNLINKIKMYLDDYDDRWAYCIIYISTFHNEIDYILKLSTYGKVCR